MFSHIFRYSDRFRRRWAEIARTVARTVASPGERRIAGMLIAHLGRQ